MQTDWHRYNLKRRVASLPPLSSEIFAEKVLASQADAAATAARALFEKECEACQKTYYSENAFNNHLGSKKHKLNAAHLINSRSKDVDEETGSIMSSTFSLGEVPVKLPSPEKSINVDSGEELSKVLDGIRQSKLDDEKDSVTKVPTKLPHSADGEERAEHLLSPPVSNGTETGTETARTGEIPKEDALRQCLFCNNYAASLQENMTHMKKEHSLFVPEQKHLINLEGLITYLNGKVYNDYQCLYCNRLKWSEDGITTHMRDMSHCKIAYETEEQQLEIGQFYDFRSTYSDDEDSDIEMGTPGSNSDNLDEGDEGWETSSTVSSVPTEELGALYADGDKAEIKDRLRQNKHHSKSTTTKHKSADGWHSHAHNPVNAVYHDEYELHLPTGRVAGHRSLNRYYRQNLRSYPTPAERADRLLTQGEDEDGDVDMDANGTRERGRGRGRDMQLISRADGGLGMLAVSESKKREVRMREKKDQRKEARAVGKMQWKNNKQSNSQKHFRDPLLQ
jgi:pre-60S factor REI1